MPSWAARVVAEAEVATIRMVATAAATAAAVVGVAVAVAAIEQALSHAKIRGFLSKRFA